MNSLKVPEAGWQLEGPPSNKSNVPQQAFALTLSDNVIEDMIKCVQNGDGLSLSLGSTPTFTYGSNSHVISPPTDSYPYDLYLTRPFDSTRTAVRLPLTGTLFEKPENHTPVKTAVKADKDANVRPKAGKTSKSSTPSGLDSDRENLQNELAALAAGREKARVVGKLPTTKKGAPKAKGKLLSGYGSTPRSMPASPGHISLGSPSSTPTLSASQQHVERAKEQRVILVHELAVQDRSLEYLTKKWTGRKEDMRTTLEKVADNLPDTKKWAMKKAYWKELDVWNYEYGSQELRQKAIDNAVRQYDKQRISASEPEWQKLLPKEERGKGKCLSKLQANLAKGPSQPPPKIKVQKADGSPSSRDETGSLDGDRPRSGAENMSRSISNPLPSKSKKISGQEAQVKRLLGNSKPKTPVTKTSPTKVRPTASKANGGRILSKEIIVNSDSSGDEAPAVVVKPKPTVTTKTKDTVIAKPRPPIREPIKQQPAKRPREDDDSSSSSGTPLSKRIKPKQPLPASRLKHRPSDASQNSRSTATTTSSHKSKNTSPTKSSPLASSPPTNASDLENEAPRASPVTKKRKMEADVKQPAPKRAAVSRLSEELVSKAQTFKVVYEKYETLHYEISALSNPPKERLGRLKDMRDRLKIMKMEIYQECPPNKV